MNKDERTGIYQSSGRGYGFFVPDDGGEDWFVPPRREGGAWDGDTVKLQPDWDECGDGQRQVGTVVAILERCNRTVVGTVRREGRELWLVPDNKRLPLIRVQAKRGRLGGGDKAAVHMLSFGGRGEPPLGRLTETFGRSGSRQAAVDATLYQYGIERFFPPDVQEEAERAPAEVEPAAIAGRRDLRDELIITIDGATAKDLDDAVSLTTDEQGRRVLGVHIADVSHYVAAGSALDREAWERGTSVYFADQVVPMLPPALSNGICSLNPRVDRLTLSCFMTLSEDGAVIGHEIVQSVIRTTARLTYAQCNAWLAENDKNGAPGKAEGFVGERTSTEMSEFSPSGGNEGYGGCEDDILPMLKDMAHLAAQLEKKRRLRGSLDLESSEAVILCDGTGHPVGMELRQPGRAEGLIEEFMLIANETVARHLHALGKPAVYRVHEKPSEDKTERLRAMLAPFGLEVRQADHFSLQKVLDAVKGKPEEAAVNAILLRSLMKARYDGENLGHFGLAADYYCHFTSPIRRYPDLMVHRILTALLEGRLYGSAEKKLAAAAQKAAVQSSERELAAQNAEREIEKFYMAEFMQGHVGERFTGTVSGVTRFGLFVLLPFGAEGMVPAEALPGDDYAYDEHRMTLTGRQGTVFSFGMPLEVVCVSADPGSGQIDFRLEGTPVPPKKKPETIKLPPKQKKKPGKRPPAPRKGRKRR
ncbi:MAG: ribonuclease R family protein [Oscillospiraceae bacterium]